MDAILKLHAKIGNTKLGAHHDEEISVHEQIQLGVRPTGAR
jgi:hypothetical protein